MPRNDTDLPALRPAPAAAGIEGDARVLAQALGQTGERRGLKGGAPVLGAARRAYLRAEWTGAHDRRSRPGALTVAEA